ncbi:hypothetical protein [Streptomyces sp. NBC_01198]|uniref:hypothetical protein n=1 Tax=Streptomyces sp. NBC_01198 TaxID=2903769 RepID=UPI002E0FBF81|nr:hypothetical protein OG702_18025 [Streptomyces sp. NBC_01198]
MPTRSRCGSRWPGGTHQSPAEWPAEQIHQRYAGRGVSYAEAYWLVDQRRVLPVLELQDRPAVNPAP